MSKMMWRYVEVTDGERWRGVITEAPSPDEAVEIAVKDAANAWDSDPNVIEEFVVRNLSVDQAERMMAKMRIGSFDPNWWLTGRGQVSYDA